MPAPSLSAMAQNAAIRSISSITDIADLPYHAVEPILRRIDNPTQLREIEIACPHIAENSAPLWQELIKRDVSKAESKMLYPKDPRSWWKVYRKMCKQEAEEKLAAEEGLKAAMMGLQEAKGSKETTFVPKVFSLGAKKTTGFFDGVKHGGNGGGKAPMLWNAKTGRDAFGAMKRATASKVKVFKPTSRYYVPDAKSQIKAVPRSMIVDNSGQEAVKRAAAEAKKYAEPTSQRSRVFSTPLATASKAEQAFRNEEIKAQLERERRLRALTGPAARPAMHPAPPAARTESPATRNEPARREPNRSPPARNEPNRSVRPIAPSQRPVPQTSAPAKRANAEVSFPPSPPSSSAPRSSQGSQSQKAAPVKRKRPVADPFLSVKRSRP
jgi:elongin-A